MSDRKWRPRPAIALPSRRRGAHYTVRDLLTESLNGVSAKPSRLVISVVGTLVGIGALVMTIGLGQTAAGQVATRFDSVAATHLEVQPATASGADGKDHPTASIPADALDRVTRLAGVEAAAALAKVSFEARITAVPVNDPSSTAAVPPPIVAVSGDLLAAVGGAVSGRMFDRGHEERVDRVAVLGAGAAQALGIENAASSPSIFIDEHAFTVVGILESSEIEPGLVDSVIVPLATAQRDLRAGPADTLALRIAVGAASTVSHQAPIALAPNAPDGFTAAAPPTGAELHGDVQGDLDLVFFMIGLITLVAGGLGIANVTMLSISERRSEIGLRRALGATRRQIAAQFMTESLVVGTLGGLIGAAVGVLTVVIVSLAQGWTPVLDLGLVLGSTVSGGLVGLAAGCFPAVRAARVEPADALRDS
ncbi:ABC transporter permease [Herbiconiux ginsengi]|uniref:Putative ABC transport system permease protein n=1 Tax=Herbiconiux ginsengi TaxID=381665 RepID=A0A1H3PZT9_9MICO|nr:ABC transporter permease [Herbiconiux ginsengi]SDZ06345.1 putative ABC transport system permease protein [Herbiconiux ginsengi]